MRELDRTRYLQISSRKIIMNSEYDQIINVTVVGSDLSYKYLELLTSIYRFGPEFRLWDIQIGVVVSLKPR